MFGHTLILMENAMTRSDTLPPDIYPVLRYQDGRAAIDWLTKAFGFRSHFEVATADKVGHAELAFGNGLVMLAASREPDPANPWSMEASGIYVAVDDVDVHQARAMAAGAQIVRPLADTAYGSCEYSARDIEGHLWSFGSYRPTLKSSRAQPPDETPKALIEEFQRIKDAFNAAMLSNDVTRIADCITEDWCLVTPERGPIGRTDILAAIKTGILSHDSMTKDIVRLKIYGDVAVVTSRGRNTGLFRGAPISADEWITDVYRRDAGEWLCVLTQLTPAMPGS